MSVKVLTIKEDILGANDEIAGANREVLDRHDVTMINIMSSPGAGKTTLIMRTIERFKAKSRVAVIEGDIASTIDADRVSGLGIPAIQINTAGACHLDANMIKKALDNLALEQLDLIIVENVGNLICTAEFALGAHRNVMILSVPEGDDKPHKYPLMFAESDVVLVNKVDVLPYFDFNMNAFSTAVKGLNPSTLLLRVSAKTGEGMGAWFAWLEGQITARKEGRPR